MCQNKYTSLYVPKPIKFQYDKVPLGVNVRDSVLLEIQYCFPQSPFWPENFPSAFWLSLQQEGKVASQETSLKPPGVQLASGRWQRMDTGIKCSLLQAYSVLPTLFASASGELAKTNSNNSIGLQFFLHWDSMSTWANSYSQLSTEMAPVLALR